ncbi:hypothetical protein [Endozoicomonas numazuensis]|uniref:Uncharacterized protein n=1 Tax=Endozoicomonas numazuensis TaxID=1137799 RepID=A0A081NG92_9GAMM|nr:hypothetical protein [Endozoicomonas numazuensis]KEQ17465.1 hypothetical protein GZ78_16970 [Endozoicomonas numazuensis]
MKKLLLTGCTVLFLSLTANAQHQISLEYDAYVLDAKDKLTDFIIRPASFDYVKIGTLTINIQYHGSMHTAQLSIGGDGLDTHHNFVVYAAIQNPLLHEQGRIYSFKPHPWKLIVLPWGTQLQPASTSFNQLQIVLLSSHFNSNKPINVGSAPELNIDNDLLKAVLDDND